MKINYVWYFIPHLGLRLLAVLSLIICNSRKEKLGSNTPINFTTSSVFSSEEVLSEPWTSSGLSEASGVSICPHSSQNFYTLTLFSSQCLKLIFILYLCTTLSCCSSSSLWMSLKACRVSHMISRAAFRVFNLTVLLFWPETPNNTSHLCFCFCIFLSVVSRWVFLTRHGELGEGHSLQQRAEQLTRSVAQAYEQPHGFTVMLLGQSLVLLPDALVSDL